MLHEHVFETQALEAEDQVRLERAIVERFPSRICRRVLFVATPQVPADMLDYESARLRRYPCYPPYGPGILVRVLEDNGFVADVIDLQYLILEGAHQAASSADFDIHSWKAALNEKVASFKPDLVGLSCMFDMGHSWLGDVSAVLRKAFPALPIVAGGVHLTLTTERLLREVPEIAFVFLYEADRTFLDFLRFVNNDVDGFCLAQVACIAGGKLLKLTKRNMPDVLEYAPDFKSLPIQRYSQVGKIGAYTFLRPVSAIASTVLTERGCRAHCSFCSVRSVNGSGVRVRTAQSVVDELRQLVSQYGVQHIMWLDDDLLYDRTRATALFSAIADANLNLTWDASNGVIAASLTEELLQACVRSGCTGLGFGIESGNSVMLKQMKKPGTVRGFLRAAELLRDAPQIFSKGFLIIGFPNETLAMLNDTVNLAVEMQLDWYPIQILTPLPGTPVFNMMSDLRLFGEVPVAASGGVQMYSIGSTGSIRRRERSEKKNALPFHDLLTGHLDRVPIKTELADLWFSIDYKVNYACILRMTDQHRIAKKAAMLEEVCQRMTTDNALGTLFLGVLWHKLGRICDAQNMVDQAKRYHDESEFWRFRFRALHIDDVLKEYSWKLNLV